MEDATIVACPTCGKKYRISPDKIGRTFKCAGCQTQFVAGGDPPPVDELQEIGFAEPPQAQYQSAPPPPPMMGYNSGAMGPKTSGMAIASLVLGIVGCVPLFGLLAIVFGIIGINQTGPGKANGRGMAITGLVLGCILPAITILMLLSSILLPAFGKARETANRAKCASNLRQIGLAILLYQNENSQQFPPDLATLGRNENLTFNVFCCPTTNDTPASSWDQLETGGHCSYTYIYPGPRARNLPSYEVVAHEKTGNHTHDGENMLFGDGHVEWETTVNARQLLNQTASHAVFNQRLNQ